MGVNLAHSRNSKTGASPGDWKAPSTHVHRPVITKEPTVPISSASGSLHHGRRPVSQISIQGGVPPFGSRRPVRYLDTPGMLHHRQPVPVLVVFAYAAPAPAAKRVDVDVNAFQSHRTACTTKAAPIVGSRVWLRYRADQGDTDLEL